MILSKDQEKIKNEIKKIAKRRERLNSIFIPKIKRKEVEQILKQMGIIF